MTKQHVIAAFAVLALAGSAAAADPVPAGSISSSSPSLDWEGVSGLDPDQPCTLVIDPACDHFYLIVEDAMSEVLVGAVRDDCEDPAPGCESFTVHLFATDAAHTPLASGEQTTWITNVPAGTAIEVQIVGPTGGTVGLTPYLGFVRSCPQGQFCLPTTGR